MKVKRILPLLLAAVIGAATVTGCNNIKADATGATLNGEEISLGFMNFMARYQQAMYDGYYTSLFGVGFWSKDLSGTGVDMETTVKAQVADTVEQLYLLEDHMADYGVELTKEELAEIDKAAEKFMSENSKDAIKQMGATDEYVKEMLRLNTIQAKVRGVMDKDVDTEVSDEEAAQKTFSYVKVSKTAVKDGKKTEYTEDEKAELKSKVEKLAKDAKEDFEKAVEEAEYKVSTYSYGSDESSFAEAVISEADKMENGEVSGLLEDEDNYYVIRMDSTFDEKATAEKKEEIIKERQDEHFTEVCKEYKEKAEYEVNESEWKKVKFDELFKMKQAEEAAEK